MKFPIKQFLLIIFLVCEALSLAVFASNSETPLACSEKSKLMLKPKVSVCFTIARRRDCEGFGICNFSVSGRWNSGAGTLQVDEYNSNIILLEIEKAKGITPEAYNKFFRSGTFIMEDDCPIPTDLAKSLGLTGTKSLVAGNYNVIERNGLLQVAIPIK